MDALPVPLWSIGVLLIVVGPFVVQRLNDVWIAAVDRRTDDALSAMTARSKARTVNVECGAPAADVTREDGVASAVDPSDPDDHHNSSS